MARKLTPRQCATLTYEKAVANAADELQAKNPRLSRRDALQKARSNMDQTNPGLREVVIEAVNAGRR